MRTEPRYSRQTAAHGSRYTFLRADGSSMKRDTEELFDRVLHEDLYDRARELHRVVTAHSYLELICSKFPQIDYFPSWRPAGTPYSDSWWQDWWRL